MKLKMNLGTDKADRIVLGGKDVTNLTAAIEVHADSMKPGVEIFLTPVVHRQAELNIEGAVYVLLQPQDLDVFRGMKELLAALDPSEVESLALERMQWGSSNLTVNIIQTIKEVIQYACDELEPPSAFGRSPDDRHDRSVPAETNGG